LALAAILGSALYIGHLRDEARQARSERDAALAAAEMRETETKVVERYHETETVIREASEPIIQTIEEAPGAQSPLPDPVLDAWRAGIDSLRAPAGAPDDNRPGSAG
jgi:hypothetical protein